MRNLVAALICLVLAASSPARTITVDNDAPADFTTIQAAIDDANDGDTIVVADGIYTGQGNININPGPGVISQLRVGLRGSG